MRRQYHVSWLGGVILIALLQSPLNSWQRYWPSFGNAPHSLSAYSPAGWVHGDVPRASVNPDQVRGKVIYGNDDRLDLEDVNDPNLLTLARSTAAQIATRDLKPMGAGRSRMQSNQYGLTYRLCSGERFYDQPTSASCTAFLVAPDVIATAGHCVQSATNCKKASWVFTFEVDGSGRDATVADNADIYSCKSLLMTKVDPATGSDFALVRLDRPVLDRKPLTLRALGQITQGEGVLVIGHPAGIPKKVAAGAQVRDDTPDAWFLTELDTYGGNSGSPVFNARTLEVEGILVRGETDFESVDAVGGTCLRSKRCAPGECAGESVTRISEVLPHLSNSP